MHARSSKMVRLAASITTKPMWLLCQARNLTNGHVWLAPKLWSSTGWPGDCGADGAVSAGQGVPLTRPHSHLQGNSGSSFAAACLPYNDKARDQFLRGRYISNRRLYSLLAQRVTVPPRTPSPAPDSELPNKRVGCMDS
jgi:hypothetical protein